MSSSSVSHSETTYMLHCFKSVSLTTRTRFDWCIKRGGIRWTRSVHSITLTACLYWLRHRERICRERQDPCTNDMEGKRWIQGSVCTAWNTVESSSKFACEVGGVRMQVPCHKTGHKEHWCIAVQCVLCKERWCRITSATSLSILPQKACHPCQLSICNLDKEPDKWHVNTGSF